MPFPLAYHSEGFEQNVIQYSKYSHYKRTGNDGIFFLAKICLGLNEHSQINTSLKGSLMVKKITLTSIPIEGKKALCIKSEGWVDEKTGEVFRFLKGNLYDIIKENKIFIYILTDTRSIFKCGKRFCRLYFEIVDELEYHTNLYNV